MEDALHAKVTSVRDYWNSHPLGLQYVTDKDIEIGTPQFFAHVRPWMNPFKFPWIMERIEHEARMLNGKHLLEIGCGLGYDSLEFLKRGVHVTATDLTPSAVELTLLHFAIEGVQAEEVRIANVLELPFEDNTFDAAWANGVLHHTGDIKRAVGEVRRVLKQGGRAIISHFYRKPSWMYLLHHLARENIEYKEEDPPVIEFLTEKEILSMFEGLKVVETVQDHYRALPIRRKGPKAWLYKSIFMPVYNRIPEPMARRLAYKFSITAIKS